MRRYAISRAVVHHVAPGLRWPATSIARKAVRTVYATQLAPKKSASPPPKKK